MIARINVIKIVINHLATLRSLNGNSKTIYFPDFILFFFLPLLLSFILTINKIELTDQVTNLIAAVSILGGFLFNLLAIIYGAMDKIKADSILENKDGLKKIFIKEIHTNISYCILLSISLTLFLVLYSFKLPIGCAYYYIKIAILFINYFLLVHFFLTLLMVLNRVYILLKKDI